MRSCGADQSVKTLAFACGGPCSGCEEEEEELKSSSAAAAAGASVVNLRQSLKLRTAAPDDNMPKQPEYLLLFHAVTCGPAAPDSELAEELSPICQLAYLVYNVQQKKVMTLAQHPVKPLLPPGPAVSSDSSEEAVETREDGRAPVSADCTAVTGVTEESLDAAALLADCLDEMDRALLNAGVHPSADGRDLRLITDGQAPLRLLLHPEAAAKGIRLPSYCYAFHDLRKEFCRARRSRQPATSLEEMMAELGLQQQLQQAGEPVAAAAAAAAARTQDTGFSASMCLAMSRIIGCLLEDGHKFLEPESISKEYRPALIRKSEPVEPETVVRLRGLPWQVGDIEVATVFFSGLNVCPGGVALVLSRTGGRRNGEALVRFECAEHRDLALLRHRRHLGRRYIEVFKATARDYLAVAAACTAEAEEFLARLDGSGQQLIRMRGLPYVVTAEQVLEFFDKSSCPVQFGRDGLLFAQRADGRATGDAFALFASSERAERALERGHRQHIGSRYVELFKSTPAELNQVLGGFQQQQQQQQQQVYQHQKQQQQIHSQQQQQQQQQQQKQQQLQQLWHQRHLLRIGGMPAEATVADILGFLEQHAAGIAYQGVHQVLNHLGQPTGEAVIEMTSDWAARMACEAKDGSQFWRLDGRGPGGVIVEVQLCGTAELPPPPPPPPPPPLPQHLLPPPNPSPLMSHAPMLLPQFPLLTVAHCQPPYFPANLPAVPVVPAYPQPQTAPAVGSPVPLHPVSAEGRLLASQTVLAI
ncbi:hypothetical protein BOX15_Mlig033028g1 [Macrostomum lignano]|uniref:RRM domain-containing protein n=1 Tax=Macrostomum lignano TaxID=282301 RepID=A0A267FF64_9PLAT|nr:hypothetical protein BOX15_Mlig033028g1 [Macrostomum lignano]